jgi:hypothetical protein
MVAWAEIWRGQVAHLARDILLGLVLVTSVLGSAWAQATDRAERARRMSEQAETRGLAERKGAFRLAPQHQSLQLCSSPTASGHSAFNQWVAGLRERSIVVQKLKSSSLAVIQPGIRAMTLISKSNPASQLTPIAVQFG